MSLPLIVFIVSLVIGLSNKKEVQKTEPDKKEVQQTENKK